MPFGLIATMAAAQPMVSTMAADQGRFDAMIKDQDAVAILAEREGLGPPTPQKMSQLF